MNRETEQSSDGRRPLTEHKQDKVREDKEQCIQRTGTVNKTELLRTTTVDRPQIGQITNKTKDTA